MALLEDRERIARDLHDHVIQTLFATGLKVQTASISPTGPSQRARLQESVVEIDGAIRQLRATIADLNTAGGSPTRTLRTAVLQVVQALAPRLGFGPDVRFEGLLDTVVGSQLTNEVVAVLREAVTDVARHAAATRVVVTLTTDGQMLSCTVVDDGVGLGATTRRRGLDNLRVRAELLEGVLVLGQPAGGGLSVHWSVPLGAGAGADAAARPSSRRRS